MDDADRAKVLETNQRQRALSAQQARASAEDAERPVMVYGIPHCIDCLEPIGSGRLKARPNAARCVDCKAAMEKRHRVS